MLFYPTNKTIGKETIVSETATSSSSVPRAILLAASIACAVLVAWLYASVVYADTADGIAYTLGSLFGAFLIALLIGFFVNKRSFTKNLVSVCLLIATAIFVTQNLARFREALEVKEYRSLVAGIKSPNDIIRLSKEHPSNRFLTFMAESTAYGLRTTEKIEAVLGPLSKYDFDCAEKMKVRKREALIVCRDYFLNMASTIRGVSAAYESFLTTQQTEARKFMSNLIERMKFTDQSIPRAIEKGFAEGFDKTSAMSREFLSAFDALNSAYIALFSFLIDQFDDYSYDAQTSRTLWSSDALLTQFSVLSSRAEKAEATLRTAAQKMQAYDNQRVENLTK
jgi:hypothetical protein